MVVESFRSSGGGVCEVALREMTPTGEAVWRFALAAPTDLVLAFLNDDYDTLQRSGPPMEPAQTMFFRETFTRGNGPMLRDLIDHVLVCEEERGFDPTARLAAYSFAHEMFDLSRVASFAQRMSLETSVVGAEAAQAMSQRWQAILDTHKQQELPRREDLFELLVRDAEEAAYPFELGVSKEYSSLPQMLRAFVVEMVRCRTLLHRCAVCGRYTLAMDPDPCPCE